jgi:hypothetical protein
MTTAFIDGDPRRQKPGVEAARELADRRYSSLHEAVQDLLAQLPAHG